MNSLKLFFLFQKKLDKSLPEDHAFKGASKTLIYDTIGIKIIVKENNPKYLGTKIKRQKKIIEFINNTDFNPCASAASVMPKTAEAKSRIKYDYLNGQPRLFL